MKFPGGLNEGQEVDFRTAGGSMFQTPFYWEAVILPKARKVFWSTGPVI